MRSAVKIAMLALLACGCSQESSQDSGELMQEPDIAPAAAPSVAFRYSYAFELADGSISEVQEKHAAACEALGLDRCRITGFNYSVHEGDAVSASLTVSLLPTLARAFGKAATTEVRDAGGRLRQTEFNGDDTAPVTSEANRQGSDAQGRIADIERDLVTATSDAERAELQAQLNQLRAELSQSQATAAAAETRLAATPMTFNYYGRGGIAGFQTNPLRESAELFVSSLVTMVTFVLRALAVLLPWAALLALVVLAARSRFGRAVGRALTRRPGYSEPTD